MNRLSMICIALIVASGLSLVSAQYRARQLFIDLETAKAVAHKLDIEWRTLQLDQTNYSKHSLIETAARRDLHMQPATPARTQYLVLTPRSAAPGSEAKAAQ
ncbi:MAG: cell division protein FtsL [Burkholderiaceae bacterium]